MSGRAPPPEPAELASSQPPAMKRRVNIASTELVTPVSMPEPEQNPVPTSAPVPAHIQAPVPIGGRIGQSSELPRFAPAPAVAVRSGWNWKLLGVLLVGAVFGYAKLTSGKNEQSCDQAFDAGLKSIAAHDLTAARNQSARANVACSGTLLRKAETLQTALTNVETETNNCERKVHGIANALDEHKLLSARTELDSLVGTCATGVEVLPLRRQLMQVQRLAATAQADIRRLLRDHDVVAAKTAIDKLDAINVEHPELAAFRTQWELIAAAKQEENNTTGSTILLQEPLPETRPVGRNTASSTAPAVETRSAQPTLRQPDISTNSRVDMGQVFLRDAERALSQKQFDTAKTFVESARRLDPNNPKADMVLKMIQERERQVLQQDTSIR